MGAQTGASSRKRCLRIADRDLRKDRSQLQHKARKLRVQGHHLHPLIPVSYTHLTLPTNREV